MQVIHAHRQFWQGVSARVDIRAARHFAPLHLRYLGFQGWEGSTTPHGIVAHITRSPVTPSSPFPSVEGVKGNLCHRADHRSISRPKALAERLLSTRTSSSGSPAAPLSLSARGWSGERQEGGLRAAVRLCATNSGVWNCLPASLPSVGSKAVLAGRRHLSASALRHGRRMIRMGAAK